MNRLFKKVVSSVLAAAMMVGSFTVANVSSVFAADSYTAYAENEDMFYVANGLTEDGATEVATSFTDGKKYKQGNYVFYPKSSSFGSTSITFTDSNKTITLNKYIVTGGQTSSSNYRYFTYTPSSDGTFKILFTTNSSNAYKIKMGTSLSSLTEQGTASSSKTTGTVVTYDSATKGSTYYIGGTGSIRVFAIIFIPDEDSPSVSLNKTELSLTPGSSETLTATPNGLGDNPEISWSSTNEDVATVNNGLVTALKEGTTTIKATVTISDDEQYNAECEVTVAEKTVPTSWSFLSGSSLINATDGVVIEGATGEVDSLKIDASSGKWNAKRSAYVQVNAGTKIKVPVDKKSDVYTVSVTTYSAGDSLTIGGIECTSSSKTASAVCEPDENGYIEIVMNTNGYFESISVTSNEYVTVPLTINAGTYTGNIVFKNQTANASDITVATIAESVKLVKGHSYKINTEDGSFTATFADDSDTKSFSSADATTINVSAATYVNLSGEITGTDASNVTALSFVNNSTGAEYEATINGKNYTAQVVAGEYTTNYITSNGATTINRVSVGDSGKTDEEVYFVEPDSTTSVEYKAEISVPDDYATLTDAVKAVKAMNTDKTVTININSNLTEQVNVDASNIVINGNGYTLTWYYALGGKYYSADSNGYYSEELFRDKYSKNSTNTKFWGGVLILNGNNIRVENLTIKNTFNYEVTDKEIEDGVEWDSNTNNTTHDTAWTRTKGATVNTSACRERALAVATIGNNLEFYKCNILSSQDTLGYNGQLSNYSYFKDCTIGGNVDYICGAGNMVFDDCELQWFNDGSNTGYITAPKKTYIFRNCKITGNAPKTGYYGRPWNTASASAVFINTDINGSICEQGYADWTSQGAVTVAYNAANFKEYANYSNGEAFKTNVDGYQIDNDEYNTLSKNIVSTYLGGWTPTHYVPSVVTGVDTAKAVIDGTTYLVVYGYVDENDIDKVESVGYELSTANNLFGKTTADVSTVYEKVTYKDANGAEKTINGNGKYIAVIAILADETEASNLYARTYSSNDNGKAYGELAVSSLN